MKKAVVISLSVIVCLQLITIISLLNRKKDNTSERRDESINRNIIHQIENVPSLDIKNLTLIGEDGKNVTVYQLCQTGKIALFISSLNCHTCVEHELNILKSKGQKLSDKILLITNFESLKEASILKDKFGLKNKLYNYSGESQLLSVKYNEPYYFLLSKTNKIDFLFSPQPNFTELTNYYLDYFDNLRKAM